MTEQQSHVDLLSPPTAAELNAAREAITQKVGSTALIDRAPGMEGTPRATDGRINHRHTFVVDLPEADRNRLLNEMALNKGIQEAAARPPVHNQ